MAEATIILAVQMVANSLSKTLIEEYAVLGGGTVRRVAWIEGELRSMHGLLEQAGQRGYEVQEQDLNEWEEKLKDVARDAEDVIETFLMKSVKRRRRGVLYWIDKHKVGKELEQICRRMRDISQTGMHLNTHVVGVSIEKTPGGEASSSTTTSVVVSPAIEKLDHILSQTIFVGDEEVMEMVERVKGDLMDLYNKIVSNLRSRSERENVWLEEVKEVCNYTESVAGNFILVKERRSKMGRLKKAVYLSQNYASENKFKKQMKYIRTRIGDAVHRSITYGVGGQLDMGVGFEQTTPVPDNSLEVVMVQIPIIIYFSATFFAKFWPIFLLLLITFHIFNVVGEIGRTIEHKSMSSLKKKKKKKKQKKKRKKKEMLITFLRCLFYTLIFLPYFILSMFLPHWAGFLLYLSSILYIGVIDQRVELLRSMDKNLKCTQRYLALMRAFLSDTESVEGLNNRQRVWVGQLRVVSRNGQSLIDAYPEDKGACFSRIKFAKDINCLLKEILVISNRKAIYGIENIQRTQHELVPLFGPIRSIQERDIENEIIVEHNDNSSASRPAGAASSYRSVAGLKKKVQSIRLEKELMDALVVDADEMRELDGRSRITVEQMRGISLEAQSVISDYDAKLEHVSILKYIFKYWTRRHINRKIDDVRSKIEDASRRIRAYGSLKIQSQVVSSSMVQISRGRTQPSLLAKESDVVGFDNDAQIIMAQLLSDEQRRCITWIVGMRGTGKTTLAKLIFDTNAIVGHFQHRLWVSVPSNCTPNRLVADIGKEAAGQVTVEEDLSILATLVRTKYLVVVDGIEEFSQVYLDTLNKAIPDMSTGSRVVFTTRNANVAQHAADTTFVHPLQLLDDESSWVLFTRHLKVDVPYESKTELIKVGKEIVMKCGGLLSQILKMSRLLSHKDVTTEEWSSVLRGKQLYEDQIQSWSETLNTVNTNLPSYLRRCLFYLVLFPAEFGIPVRRLVVLWIAESLVLPTEDDEVPPELVAERYLTELIDRNMVQVVKRKRNGNVKTCRLPSVLRQLWLTEAKESRLLQGSRSATDSNADPKMSIIRRVADRLDKDDFWNDHIHGDIADSTTLKTYYKDVLSFLSFDTQEGSKPGQQVGNFIKGCITSDCFLLLRVLDLERVYRPKLPKHIARLTRLRYLGLRWTYLESLPSSISKLLKLQTLDLKHTYIHTLPSSIWKMELRHLFLSETYRTRFPPQPKDHFSNIRFLLPQLRDNFLYDLQTLWGLFVDEETLVKDGLDTLVNITKLGLVCQSMSLQSAAMITQLEAVADWIANLEHLQSLRLKSRDEEGKPWTLHLKSFENNVNLNDMYLLGRLSSSSILSQFPKSLVELTLSHSKLEEDPMQLLKELSNLRTLSLLADSYVGQTMFCRSQIFPQLHVLNFWKLDQFEEWIIEPGALPCLKQLEIRSCSRLKMLPDVLKQVTTLLELKLTNMPMDIDANTLNIPLNCQVAQTNFQ